MTTLPPRRTGGDPRLRVSRPVAADATSLALLLAGPAILEAWPAVECTEDGRGHLTLAVDLPAPSPRTVRLHVSSPVRSVTSFLLRMHATGDGLPPVEAVLEISRDPRRLVADGVPGSTVEIALHPGAEMLPRVREAVMGLVEGFLDVLAAAGEGRSAAA